MMIAKPAQHFRFARKMRNEKYLGMKIAVTLL